MKRSRLILAAVVAVSAVSAGVAFAGVGSWGPAKGPFGGNVEQVAIDPQSPATLYVSAAFGGLFKSRDGRAHWASSGFLGKSVPDLAIDPRTPSTLYAVVFLDGLWKSTDGGASWRRAGFADTDVAGVAVDPADPRTVYALAVSPKDPRVVVAAVFSGRVFETTDGGETWKPGPPGSLGRPHSLLFDPLDPNAVYVVAVGGVFRATIGGTKWRTFGDRKAIYALAADPRHANVLYGGVILGGVIRSTDGGRSWRPFDRRLTNDDVGSIAFDSSGKALYAGTDGGSVFDYRFG